CIKFSSRSSRPFSIFPATLAKCKLGVSSTLYIMNIGKIPLTAIWLTEICKWQNNLTGYRDENGKPYSQTYLKTINNQLTAILNYAVKITGWEKIPATRWAVWERRKQTK
ncbi:MAG: hypothetical protein RR075_02135, partial [Pygmaiobacter sp.]